ncbi:MAG: TlpA disulfide reductase family protein [Salegentibacter sp.]
MKKITQVMALGLLAVLSSCSNQEKENSKGQDIGNLHLSREYLHPGDSIRISYRAATDSATAPEATANYIVGTRFYPVDIDLQDSSGVWMGQIAVPDSAQALAFQFKVNGDNETNEHKGYVVPLFDEEGNALSGSKAGMGNYYLREGRFSGIEVEKDSALAMMEKDFSEHPELKEKFDMVYPNMLTGSDSKKADSYIEERLKFYENKDSLSGQDYEVLDNFYRLQKDPAKADSVQQIAMEKYPKSDFAKSVYRENFYRAQGIENRKAVLDEYNQKVGEPGKYQDFMYNYLARDYAQAGDYDAFQKTAEKISDPSTLATLYNSIAWDMAEEGKNIKQAEALSGRSLELLAKLKTQASEKPDYYSEKQFKKSLDGRINMYQDTYALTKYKAGDVAAAAEIQAKAIDENSSQDMTTRYIKYLTELKKYKEVQELAHKFISKNKGGEEMKGYLKTAWKKNNGSMEGFDDYLAEAETAARNASRKELKKEMLDKKAPEFSLKDLDGNEVALADLKGKTVILDFWATWCGPCKASFPAMQTALNDLKQNEDVEFLFIDTMENGQTDARKKRAGEFIESKDYSFHVLLDTADEGSDRAGVTANAYGVAGIPTKFVIDPQGKIRFKVMGYDGNDQKLVDELKMMIELAQKIQEPEA